MKKILTAILIGSFVFGVGATNFVSAKSIISDSYKYADGRDSHADKNMQSHDGKNPPEPPKDSNGNPLPPPDKKDGDNMKHDGQNPPEPPKDSNGNPLPPPDKKDGENIKPHS